MKKLKVFFNASTISLLIFWGVQMLFYISTLIPQHYSLTLFISA